MAQKGRNQQVAPKYRNKGVDNPLIQSGSNFLACVWIFLLEDMLSDLNLKDRGKMIVPIGGTVCGFFCWKIFYLICI